jgi:hypothetical protein
MKGVRMLTSEITNLPKANELPMVSESSLVKGAIGIFHGCWLCLIDSVKELSDSEVRRYLIKELSYGIPIKDMAGLYQVKKRVVQMPSFARQQGVDEKIIKLLEEAGDALQRVTLNRVIKYLNSGGEF